MPQSISLKDAEKKAFRTSYDDGLWDIMLGCFVSMFAIAPFLSRTMGDFWSSVVFVPFWGLAYLVVRLIRKNVVAPRIGLVKFGRARKAKLAKFTIVMLVMNVSALVLGTIAGMNVGKIPGQMTSMAFGMILLIGFSTAAYFLDFTRLYIYGLMAGLSPLIGEWLWAQKIASHHGFPITFGTTAVTMVLVGLIVFVRMVRNNPVPVEAIRSEKA